MDFTSRIARRLGGKKAKAVEVPTSMYFSDEEECSPPAPKKPAFADAKLQFRMSSTESESSPRRPRVVDSVASSTQSAIEICEVSDDDESLLISAPLDKPKPTRLSVKLFNAAAKVPVRGTPQSAGLDLFTSESIFIPPHAVSRVDTAVSVEIPTGYWGQVLDRSSNVMDMQIHVVAGVIDSDYRGTIKVCLYNMSAVPVTLPMNFKVAQLVIAPYLACEPKAVTYLSVTERGSKGFGSTDKRA